MQRPGAAVRHQHVVAWIMAALGRVSWMARTILALASATALSAQLRA